MADQSFDLTFETYSTQSKSKNSKQGSATTRNLFESETFDETMFDDLQSTRSISGIPSLNLGMPAIAVESPIILQNIPLYQMGDQEIPLQPFRQSEFAQTSQLPYSPEAFELPYPPRQFLDQPSFSDPFLNTSFNLVDQLVTPNIQMDQQPQVQFDQSSITPQFQAGLYNQFGESIQLEQDIQSKQFVPFFDSNNPIVSDNFAELEQSGSNSYIPSKKTKEDYDSYIQELANYYRHLIRFNIVSKSSKGGYKNNFNFEYKHFFDNNTLSVDRKPSAHKEQFTDKKSLGHQKHQPKFIPCIILTSIEIDTPSNYGSPQELIISLFEELTKEGSDLEGLFYKFGKSDKCEIYLDWSPLKKNSLIIRSKFLNYQTQKAILKHKHGIGFNEKLTKLSILIIKELTSNYLDLIKKEILAKNFINKKKIYKYNLYTYWYNFQITGIGTPDGVCRAMLDELVKQCNLGDSLKYKFTNMKNNKVVEFTWENF